jgi:hypothetical protein
MGNCRFTLTNNKGNIILDGISEQEFKKYIAMNPTNSSVLMESLNIPAPVPSATTASATAQPTTSTPSSVPNKTVEDMFRETAQAPFRNANKIQATTKSWVSRFMTALFESQRDVIKKMLKDLKYPGQVAVAALQNRKGYTGVSSLFIRSFNKEIFDDLKITPNIDIAGMKHSERTLFDMFLDLSRVINIDERIGVKFYNFTQLREKLKNDKSLTLEQKKQIRNEKNDLLDYLKDRNAIEIVDGKYVQKQYVHSRKLTAETAQEQLDLIKKTHPEVFKKLEDKANKYYNTYKTLLTEQFNNGMLSKEVYDELLSYNYIPSKFIHYIVEAELAESASPNGSKLKNTIRTLTGGSDQDVLTNFQQILELAANSTYRQIFENTSANSLARAVEANAKSLQSQGGVSPEFDMYVDKPIGVDGNGQPKYNPIPAGKDVIYFYRDNGVRERIVAPKDFVDVYYERNKLLNQKGEDILSKLSTLTFVNIFKSLITKNNPAFGIYQLTMDAPQAIIATRAYPDFFLGSFLLAKDYASVTKDIKNFILKDKLSPLFKEAISAGIFSDFLSTETDVNKLTPITNIQGEAGIKAAAKLLKYKAGKSASAVLDGIAKMNEGIEYATRLAVFKRMKDKLTAEYTKNNKGAKLTPDQEFEVLQLAALEARKVVDFSRSGTLVKPLNKVLAYLNAGMRGFYSSAQSLKNNPTKAAMLFGEIGTAATMLFAYSIGDFGGDEEEKKKRLNKYMSLPEYQRTNYFNIYNPFSKEGSDYEWIRLYKPQTFRGYINFLEQGYLKVVKGQDINEGEIYESFKADLPVDPTSFAIFTRNPLFNGIVKYSLNKDAYKKSEIVRNEERIEDWAEYDKKTPKIYKKIGEYSRDLTGTEGVSPKRAEALIASLIGDPSKNTTTALLDKSGRVMYYGAMGDKEGLKSELPAPGEEADWLFKLSGLKGRIFTKTPDIDFEAMKEYKDAEKKEYTKNQIIKTEVDEIYENEPNKKEAEKLVVELLNDNVNNGIIDRDDKKRILNVQNKREFIKDKPRYYGTLLYMKSNDIKASVLYDQTQKLDDDKYKEVARELYKNKIISEEVLNIVRRKRNATKK